MLIFAPHVVQTFPEPATRSDLMYIFVKGYLEKKYGVQKGITQPKTNFFGQICTEVWEFVPA